jgi:hypothetical protein
VHPLLTLTREPLGLDVGPDGSLFVDQVEQPNEVRWYPKAGARPLVARIPNFSSSALPLDHGRALVATRSVGKWRVMVVEPGKPLAALAATSEETNFPATMLGPERVALVVGSGTARRVAIVAVATGNIISSIEGVDGAAVQSLAGSRDGKTLFYSADGAVWAMPVDGGKAQKIGPGHSVSADPDGHYLVVKRRETKRVSLVRVPWPLGTGDEREIRVQDGDLRLVDDWSVPNAIGPGGRLVVRVASKSSWYYPAAVLDPQTGRLEPLDAAFDCDMLGPAWTSDGQIVTTALSFESTLWRFRPKSK